MKCPVCDKELIGKQKYCSGACKMKAARNRNTNVTKSSPNVTPSVTKTVTAKLERIEGYEDFYTEPGCSHIEGVDTCLKSYCPNYRGVKYYEKFPKREMAKK